MQGVKAGPTTLDLSKSAVCLRGTGQGFHGQIFVVPKQQAVIGRQPDSDIVISHPTISRHHCRIELHAGGVYVKDLESVNGTWVNNTMILEAFLRQGDILRIGDINFVMEIRSLADFDPKTKGVTPPTLDSFTTRLMGVGDAKPQALKYENLRRDTRNQNTRLTRLFGLGR